MENLNAGKSRPREVSFLSKGQKSADTSVIAAQSNSKKQFLAMVFMGLATGAIVGAIVILSVKGDPIPGELIGLVSASFGFLAGAMSTNSTKDN